MTGDNREGHELRAAFVLAAPRASVWRCWTEPGLLGALHPVPDTDRRTP